MADISDVENALVALIAQTLYPSGTAQPCATGVPTLVYAGWPQASQLDADLAAIPGGTGRIHVTVFPTATEKKTTRYSNALQDQTVNTPTLALTINGQQVTVSGTVSVPQNLALLVNGQAYAYAVQPTDTLASIATALAALVPGASSVGAVITLPATAVIHAARTGAGGTSVQELRRQERTVMVTVWADTPANRAATAKLIDAMFAGVEFITLVDGSSARLLYQASHIDDMPQKANCFRRDLLYSIEYATTQQVGSTAVIVAEETLTHEASGQLMETIYQ